jgi:hypothetical protein
MTLDEAVAILEGTLVGEDTAETYDEHGLALISRDAVRAAVRAVALAALRTQPHLHEYEHVNSPCDPSAVMEVSSGCPRCCCEAEIKRLLPEMRQETAGGEKEV